MHILPMRIKHFETNSEKPFLGKPNCTQYGRLSALCQEGAWGKHGPLRNGLLYSFQLLWGIGHNLLRSYCHPTSLQELINSPAGEDSGAMGKLITSDTWYFAATLPMAAAARLEEMLSNLPEGAEALMGENGRNISGGEAPRLGLARCLAHGAQFMVFDEVAASLDNRNAEEIEKTILSLPEAGVLMITHRVFAENMRRYDRIFVLKAGALVEQGPWEELTGQRGQLYRLSLQAGNNEP